MAQSITQGSLKKVLEEATESLAWLDGERLEEIALCCAMQMRGNDRGCDEGLKYVERESEQPTREMAIFLRVLQATKANLQVMRRLREMRGTKLEYGSELLAVHAVAEEKNGND
jgi:hypothetical protein